MKDTRLSRRDFLRLSALTGAGTILAACAKQATEAPAEALEEEPVATPPPAENVKITVWGWWQDRMNFFQESGTKFTAENPNIEVEVISIDQDLWPKVYASVPASTGPTLLKMITTNYFAMRDQGLLLELDEISFERAFLKEKFPNHPWDAYGYYVIPEGNQGALMMYNKKMFEEAGLDPENPPKTWDTYVEAAKKLTQTENGAIKVEGYSDDGWIINLNYLYQQDAMVVTRDGGVLKANFNTPEMGKTYQFLQDAAFTHKIWDYAFPYVSEAFGSGLAATAIGEAWLVGEIKSNFPEVGEVMGFAAPPTPTGEAKPYYGRQNSVLGLSSVINRPDNETEAGRKFLKFLYKEDVESQFKLSNISGLVPAHADNLTRAEVVNDPFYKLMVELVAKEYDTVEVINAFADIFYAATDMLIVQQDSIETVLEYGQTQLQTLIDNGELKYIQ